MSFTNAQLANGGLTAHYQIVYDDTFPAADGWVRAAQVMDNCEGDFNLIQEWFSGVTFQFSFPVNVQIANGTGERVGTIHPTSPYPSATTRQ